MEQVSFAGVEIKRHPDAKGILGSRGCVDRLIAYPSDEGIARDIIETYRAIEASSVLSLPSGEWSWIFANKRRQFQAALQSADWMSAADLLRNFFRDDVSFGLVSHSFQDVKKGGEESMLEFTNKIMLDVDTWLEFCDSSDISELEIPAIGNPFGIEIEGKLIVPDACRHSYHASKLNQLTTYCNDRPTILEIGGGYGGVFWSLLTSLGKTRRFCYINCDLPETLFVFYYFVMTGAQFPPNDRSPLSVKWAIDGNVTQEDTEMYDLILVPAARHNIINCGIDIAYNANSFSEMSRQDLEEYFRTILRNQPKFIFHQNSNFFPWSQSSRGHVESLARDFPIDPGVYNELSRAIAPWMGGSGRYREYLYVRKDATVLSPRE